MAYMRYVVVEYVILASSLLDACDLHVDLEWEWRDARRVRYERHGCTSSF